MADKQTQGTNQSNGYQQPTNYQPNNYQQNGYQQPNNYQPNNYQPPVNYQQPNYGYNNNSAQVQEAVEQAFKKEKRKKQATGCLVSLLTIVFLLIFFVILMETVFGDSDSDSDATTEISTGQAASSVVDESNVGNFKVEYKSAEIKKDGSNNILVVTYTFTNNSGSATAWDSVLIDHGFQNGIEVECYYFDDDAENSGKQIQPGYSIDVKIAYILNDTTTPVDIEVSELFSWDDDVYKVTIPLQ